MKWSDAHQAWYSVGKIGISNILEDEINAKLEGFLEVNKTDGVDVFNLFIKGSPSTWYYFGYEDNKLRTFSSNSGYMGEIRGKTKVPKPDWGNTHFWPATWKICSILSIASVRTTWISMNHTV